MGTNEIEDLEEAEEGGREVLQAGLGYLDTFHAFLI